MSDDSQINELLQEGIDAVKAGYPEEARQILMEVVELDDRNEQGWLWLSGVVETLEDRRVCLENVLAINPENTHARSGLAWLDQHEDQDSEAQERCPRCQATLPSSGSACPECGLPLIVSCPGCAEYMEVEKSVCTACGTALGDFRQGAAYHLAMAQAHLAHGRTDRAKEGLALAEAEAGDNPEVWAGLASAYANLGRSDQAKTAYERAIEGDPNRATLYAGLATLHRQRGQDEQAQELYDKANELAAGNSNALCSLARTYLAEGARVEALHCLEQVLKANPKNAEAHLLLGDAYRLQDRMDRAYRLYETAVQLAPQDSAISQEAQRKLEQVRAVSGFDPAVRQVAGDPYIRARPQKRPGCVTIYALLMGIGGLFGLLGAAFSISMMGTARKVLTEALEMAGPSVSIDVNTVTTAMSAYAVVVLVMACFNLAVAIGLWYLKNWARIIVIILSSLNLLLSLAYGAITLLAFRSQAAAYGPSNAGLVVAIPVLINLLIPGLIIFWFAINRDLFS